MTDFFDNIEKALNTAASAALAAMGVDLAKEMKSNLEAGGSNDTGRLGDSITWATKDAIGRDLIGAAAKESDVISQPTGNAELHVGTAAPHGVYVEYGTGPHVANGEQNQEFIDNLVAWANRHGWTGEDGGPATEKDIYPLIKKIREEGTTEHPFVRPTEAYANGEGSAVLSDILNRFLKQGFSQIPKTVEKIDIQINVKGGNQ
jgi:hypothetical protein